MIAIIAFMGLTLVGIPSVTVADDFICCDCGPGTGTPGYWKNHPEAWPVPAVEIGGEPYDIDEAIYIMKQPVKGNKCITMFKALVAAKLNVLANPYPNCAGYIISQADAWMETHCANNGAVEARSEAWQRWGECYYLFLDRYNNGYECVPSRDVCECD